MDSMIPEDHLLRRIKNRVNFDFMIVSIVFRKFNSCHLVTGSQPAMISDNRSSSDFVR